MATTTFEDSMSEDAGPSTRATLFRNDDALSQALRDVSSINLGDIVRLNQMAARSGDTASSVATSSTAVFTHREESTVTKPTSTDTYPRPKAPTAKGKGKLGGSFASSLSGNNGSASEAEVERGALRRNSLFAIGDWADPQPTSSRALKGTIRAKERLQIHGTSKRKKPIVVIEQGRHVVKPIRQHNDTDVITTTVASSQRNAGKKYLRQRTSHHDDDLTRLAEEGRNQIITPAKMATTTSLSRTRVYALGVVGFVMGLTMALAAFGAHSTGKARLSQTKIIVFTATALLACLMVSAMLIARRVLSEALLAGMLQFSFGFALLVELDEFM
ncbi:hypothetical protein HBI56_232230 [Parastagonospora nodorum]|uniref:Uncharacterized protein n=1 Tax=Phaeosphaeria nodorum (strain SN15 / ATCC MYA-4574 / FGSC 10173) TaxID=321614 RepID=A0A7U2F6B3_PHANO|nr:hypothetical protein HBH56_235540 [Parastagonospora nodorum]QRC99535.1 hypothetical protein JI435_144430 [Parastagonospora nodorum SN15]KAH3924390.1 hypothetical protein HBH54_192850 [Parastagonospora nodorum]KAH3939169.1 hypothetical protein HBH53_238580 [Parastagonospora nodorum]KAH3957129.1 hypothetical protein HBH51_229760 [Parastagonospora nodorum]